MDGTILLIDYSEYEREKNKIIFENIGEYSFIESDSLKKFYNIIRDIDSVTLIIMDIAFPVEKEGLEVLAAIRNNSKTVNTPIIIATKSDNAGYRHAALKFKVSDFVLKPYSTKRLENSIRSVLKIAQRFRYELDSANVISMSIEDYISKEFKVASRAGQNLSIILMVPINLKKDSSERSMGSFAELEEKIQNIAIEKVKLSLRSTDTAILNENKDILVILPFTNASGAQKVLDKTQDNVVKGLNELNIDYSDYYYAVCVTFPHDGKTFQSLMEKAIKKVDDKITLEKITSLGANVLDNARKTYRKYNK